MYKIIIYNEQYTIPARDVNHNLRTLIMNGIHLTIVYNSQITKHHRRN